MISEQDMAEMYRNCWCVGNGRITPLVFFTVATEENFFIKLLQLKSMLPLPYINEENNNEIDEI